MQRGEQKECGAECKKQSARVQEAECNKQGTRGRERAAESNTQATTSNKQGDEQSLQCTHWSQFFDQSGCRAMTRLQPTSGFAPNAAILDRHVWTAAAAAALQCIARHLFRAAVGRVAICGAVVHCIAIMLRYAVWWCIMLCCVVHCCAVLCCVMQGALLCCARCVLCCAVPCCVVLCKVLCCAVLCRVVVHNTCWVVHCCAVMCCVMQGAVLCCAGCVLCCAGPAVMWNALCCDVQGVRRVGRRTT